MNREEMVRISAGSFTMGSVEFYAEEGPVREVEVESFAIDRDPVTVAQFARFIEKRAQQTSGELARERGPFAHWKGSRWERQGSPPLRNATTTTIAPTGTLSILAGCSGGIEPLYAVSFVRQVLDGDRLVDVHPLFVAAARAGGWYSDQLMQRVADRGSVRGMDEVPAAVELAQEVEGVPCPECGASMPPSHQGACTVCLECGYSRCL